MATSNFGDWDTAVGEVPRSSVLKTTMDCHSKLLLLNNSIIQPDCNHSCSRDDGDDGVIIDSQLSLDAHVAAVCRSGYYQLRQLRPVTWSLSADAAKTLVQAFMSTEDPSVRCLGPRRSVMP